MDDSLSFKFARLSNFYQSPLVILIRIGVFLFLLFSIFSLANSGLSTQAPLGFLSIVLMVEVFFRFKVERAEPDKISLVAAKILVSAQNSRDFLAKLLKLKNIKFFLKKADIAPSEIQTVDIKVESLLPSASASSVDLMLAYLLETEKITKLLFKKELKESDLLNIAHWARLHFSEKPHKIRVKLWGQGIGEEWVSGWTLETQRYTIDFTKKALRGSGNFFGREKELEALTQILLKSRKQNVILVGSPGVGKTTIVRALALKLFLGDVPSLLSHKRIFELSVGSLLAGVDNQGILEERIKNILLELEHAGDIILYIPELQNIAGGTSFKFDATGVLLPALLGDKLQVVGTTTPENYKAFIERNPPFANAFEKIEIREPERETCLKMLEEAALYLEQKHKVNITYKTVVVACDLSNKYLPDRFLPGKAIDLLDEAAASAVMQAKKDLKEQDLISLIEAKTHITVGPPQKREKETLLNLEKILHQKIVDQEEAVRVVSEALRRLRSGVVFEDRPVGTFLFLGPTGVGKTETAKALARVYFGSEDAMIRFDMSEYQYEDSVTRLLDLLVDKVRERPFSLVLLDEFEKTNPKVLDIFLQVFEDGRLADSQGRTASFVNTIIIATSNAGGELIREKVSQGVSLQKLKFLILDQLQRLGVFKPELLNRFDAMVLFEPLGEREVIAVTELILSKLAANLKEKDIKISFDDRVVAKIAKEGFDKTLGARPLRRFIQDNIENLIAKKILEDEIKRGDTIIFSTDSANSITLTVNS